MTSETQEAVIALIMVLLTLGLLAVWTDMKRSPGAWRRRLDERVWRRIAWRLAAAVVVMVAVVLACAGPEAAGAAIALGGLALVVVVRVWALARTFARDRR